MLLHLHKSRTAPAPPPPLHPPRLRVGAELEDEPERIPAAVELAQSAVGDRSEIELRAWPLRAGTWLPLLVAQERSWRCPLGEAIEVVPAEAHAAQSYAQGGGLHSGVAGHLLSFSVYVRDRFCNALPEGAAHVRAVVRRVPEGAAVGTHVRQGAPGEALVTFSTERVGNLQIEVEVAGEPLAGLTPPRGESTHSSTTRANTQPYGPDPRAKLSPWSARACVPLCFVGPPSCCSQRQLGV